MSGGTDLMGNMPDLAPKGQRQMMRERIQLLTDKRPLLETPGSDIENPLYYDNFSSTVQPALMIYKYGQDNVSSASLYVGGQHTFYVNNMERIGQLSVYGQLQGDTMVWDHAGGNRMLRIPEGYGFGIVNTITYFIGASNVANVSFDGMTNMLSQLAACDTVEKRSMLMRGAGRAMLSATNFNVLREGGLSDGGVIANTSAIGIAPTADDQLVFRNIENVQIANNGAATYVNTYDPTLLQFRVPLRLPWSSYNNRSQRLFFDTKLLSQPLQLNFTSRAGYGFIHGALAILGGAAASLPNQFGSLSIRYQQQELYDKSLSLRQTLLANPDLNASIPFQFLQPQNFPVPALGAGLTTAGERTVALTAFMNADLTEIFFQVKPPLNEETEAGVYHEGLEIQDIKLSINGQTLLHYPGDSYQDNALQHDESTKFPYYTTGFRPVIAGAGVQSVSRILATRTTLKIYELPRSAVRSIANESHMENTTRHTSQKIDLTFKVPPTVYNMTLARVQNLNELNMKALQIYCGNSYNAVIQYGGEGGTSQLFTE